MKLIVAVYWLFLKSSTNGTLTSYSEDRSSFLELEVGSGLLLLCYPPEDGAKAGPPNVALGVYSYF